jgi:hypothetical protein
MTTEQIDQIVEAISSLDRGNDLWALVVMIIVVPIISGAAAYYGSYLRKKGENLATKEDLRGITTTVESIRSVFETEKALKLAALGQRLEAHQKAYALWKKLVSVSNRKENGKECSEHVMKCQEWWNENCLYLDDKAREAFRLSYMAAHSRPNILASGHGESMRENFEIVIAAGEKIVAGAALPPLNVDKEEDPLNE